MDLLNICRMTKREPKLPYRLRSRYFYLWSPERSQAECRVILELAEEILIKLCSFWEERFCGSIWLELASGKGSSPWMEYHPRLPMIHLPPQGLGESSMVHEIGHCVAFNNHPFLREGLAVCLQYELSTERVWPFKEKRLQESLKRRKGMMVGLPALIDAKTGIFSRCQATRPFGRIAYAQAGSFVSFLIRSFGLKRFKEFFFRVHRNPERFELLLFESFGSQCEQMERRWRAVEELDP